MSYYYRLIIMLLIFAVLFSAHAFADIIVLKDGRKLEGKVTRKEKSVRLDRKHGSVSIPLEDIKEIIEKITPDEEYEKRLKTIRPDDADAYLSLYLWAIENVPERKDTRTLLLTSFELKRASIRKGDTTSLLDLYKWGKKYGIDHSDISPLTS